jgi:sugar/nucleoside kinase (ribokinase family)
MFELYKSCRGYSSRHIGGIARNIAEVCARLQTSTTLITPLGNDQYSKMIIESSKRFGIDLKQIYSPNSPTASYLTVMDGQNDEMIGISEM